MLNKKIIDSITNQQQLCDFLQNENNSYSKFILELLKRDYKLLENEPCENHHIIPRHVGGVDNSWNIIKLTKLEHIMAHELLFENYKKSYDLGASKMLQGRLKEGEQIIRQAAQQTMKEQQKGFYNPELQRELAKRPRKPRSPSVRCDMIQYALEHGFDLEHGTGDIIHVEPYECSHLQCVVDKIMNHPRTPEQRRNDWNNCTKKGSFTTLTRLNRLISGSMPKTGNPFYTVDGWSLRGINLID